MGDKASDCSGAGSGRRKVAASDAIRLESGTKYVRSSKTISGRLQEEMVMMDPFQGKYFSLNPVATRIWDLLEKPLSAEELCIILIDEYDVEADRCRYEVEEHLKEMMQLGLV
ncbi:MAG: PqqD family protein, partial [Bacteroidales bacterium]|nr:PqqD family protein [Bacteroidales bacterium]